MFRNLLRFLILACMVAGLMTEKGWAQNETPANVPAAQPSVTAVPAIAPTTPPQVEPEATPKPRPSRTRTPAVVDEDIEEQPLYMNMAVYVGGFCFLVVFIGLYMIMSSTPKKSKRRRKT